MVFLAGWNPPLSSAGRFPWAAYFRLKIFIRTYRALYLLNGFHYQIGGALHAEQHIAGPRPGMRSAEDTRPVVARMNQHALRWYALIGHDGPCGCIATDTSSSDYIGCLLGSLRFEGGGRG